MTFREFLFEAFSASTILKIKEKFRTEDQNLTDETLDYYIASYEKLKDNPRLTKYAEKHGIKNSKDIFTYTWKQLESVIDALPQKVVHTDQGEQNKGFDVIHDDANIKICKVTSKTGCIHLTQKEFGKSYSFCIGRPEASMWDSYRLGQNASFYFVYDKNKQKQDNAHLIVLHSYNNGEYKMTLADNKGDEHVTWNEIIKVQPHLAKYKNLFVPIAFSSQETELKAKQYTKPEEFHTLTYQQKAAYIALSKRVLPNDYLDLDSGLQNAYINNLASCQNPHFVFGDSIGMMHAILSGSNIAKNNFLRLINRDNFSVIKRIYEYIQSGNIMDMPMWLATDYFKRNSADKQDELLEWLSANPHTNVATYLHITEKTIPLIAKHPSWICELSFRFTDQRLEYSNAEKLPIGLQSKLFDAAKNAFKQTYRAQYLQRICCDIVAPLFSDNLLQLDNPTKYAEKAKMCKNIVHKQVLKYVQLYGVTNKVIELCKTYKIADATLLNHIASNKQRNEYVSILKNILDVKDFKVVLINILKKHTSNVLWREFFKLSKIPISSINCINRANSMCTAVAKNGTKKYIVDHSGNITETTNNSKIKEGTAPALGQTIFYEEGKKPMPATQLIMQIKKQPITEALDIPKSSPIDQDKKKHIESGTATIEQLLPKLPSSYQSFLELLGSDSYKHTIDALAKYTGKPVSKKIDMFTILMQAMQIIQDVAITESKHKKYLEGKAIELVLDLPEFEEFKQAVESGNVTINAELTSGMPIDLSDLEEGEIDDEIRLTTNIVNAVTKRQFANMITQGFSVNYFHLANFIKHDLAQLSPNLLDKYNILMAILRFQYWIAPEGIEKMSAGSAAGSENVEFKEGEIVINAKGICFPVLVTEIIKGAMEVVSYYSMDGLSAGEKKEVLKREDLSTETFDILIGPALTKRLFEDIELQDAKHLFSIYQKILQLPVEAKNDATLTFKGALHRILLKQNSKALIKQFVQEIERE